MDKFIIYMAAVLIAVLILTVWTNLVVAITKKAVAWDKFPVQAWVLVVALVSTLIAAAAAAQMLGIAMLWYYWAAAVVVGLLVCYAAMYGYDNLYKQVGEMLKQVRQIIADYIGGK